MSTKSQRANLLTHLNLGDEADALALLAAEAVRCRQRDYNEEGIPMFLVLENLDGAPAPTLGDAETNALLAGALDLALEALGTDEVGHVELATAVEVIADRWFTSAAESTQPSPNSAVD